MFFARLFLKWRIGVIPSQKYSQGIGCVVDAVEFQMCFVITFPDIVHVHMSWPS